MVDYFVGKIFAPIKFFISAKCTDFRLMMKMRIKKKCLLEKQTCKELAGADAKDI